jgi:hypothetical protein
MSSSEMTFSLPLSTQVSGQPCDFANNLAEFLGPFVQLLLEYVLHIFFAPCTLFRRRSAIRISFLVIVDSIRLAKLAIVRSKNVTGKLPDENFGGLGLQAR